MPVAQQKDPLFDLTDAVIVVTGGLGQLGRQYVEVLLARGARVAVLENRGTAADLQRAFPSVEARRLMLLTADVARRSTLDAALATLVDAWGPPQGLVNNAALDSPPNAPASENGPFETYPVDSWDKVMETNAKGVFQCCQVFGGAMAKAGRGSIVNISSIYGVVSPDQRLYEHRRESGESFFKPVAYTASKSALFGLTRYLATYWADKGVRTNLLVLAGVFNNQDPRFLDAYRARMPLGRMAEADEYNGAIVFLLSQASSYMTGSTLTIDGGWTAW